MREVHIDIDEIVLDGVEVSNPEEFRAALTAALSGLAQGHQGHLPPGTASVLHGEPISALALGADVARSAWRSIAGDPSKGT